MFATLKSAAVILTTILITACAATGSTMLTERWKDKNYNERLSKVLVVGISENVTRRRLFEDTLVEQLKKRGLQAYSSAELIPPEQKVDKDTIRAAAKEKSVDAVIVTRLVSVDKEASYLPGAVNVDSSGQYSPPKDYYYNFNDYISEGGVTTQTPGKVVSDTIFSLETNLYEVKNEKLIWSITSETFNPNDINKAIDNLSKIIVNRLSKDNLI